VFRTFHHSTSACSRSSASPTPSTSGAEAMPQEISSEQLKSFLTKGTAPLSSPPPTLTADRTPTQCHTPSMARTS
jgi:hypothetical protein